MRRSVVWVEPDDVPVDARLRAAVGGHPLVSAVLGRRGIHRLEDARPFLDPTRYHAAKPEEIPNLDRAVQRIERAISKREPICVWGDFDVDGQTATTLFVEALRSFGAEVNYYIPIRNQESHGVHIPKLETLISQGVALLLTCDTGVTAHDAVDFAGSHGVDTIVTDHHDLPDSLPTAFAVVNPKMLAQDHPLHDLPGVGVAYKVIEALVARMPGDVSPERALDLVALGIVADLALLRGDVRHLLKIGLERIKRSPRLGLQALMEVAGLQTEHVSEEQIAFIIAPRLNAVGRLGDANPVIDFLTTDDRTKAKIFATELEGLNARRKLMCDQVTQAALSQIESNPALLEEAALVIAQDRWPAGVIGIVANRLVDRFHLPTIVFSTSPDGYARGSARSIEGIDISAAIATQTNLLEGFGGHPMAAGMSIRSERIPVFRRQLSEAVREMTQDLDVRAQLVIDGFVDLQELTLDFADDLNRLAPFGPGNPNVVLATKGVMVVRKRKIGRQGEHLELLIRDHQNVTRKMMWWRGIEEEIPEDTFDVAYHLGSTEYRGQRDVQLTWVDARHGESIDAFREGKSWRMEFVDHRQEQDVRAQIDRLQRQGVQIWIEGQTNQEEGGRTRLELQRAVSLAICTPPPGHQELRQVIDRVSPRVVYLFAGPTSDDLEEFLNRLMGMIKYAIRERDGKIDVHQLAAATAQRVLTVRKAVSWLVARGDIDVVVSGTDQLTVAKGGGESESREAGIIMGDIKLLIDETAAFRKFYREGDTQRIFDW